VLLVPEDDVQVTFIVVRQFASQMWCRVENHGDGIIQDILILLHEVLAIEYFVGRARSDRLTGSL
jgi:hypothetical protein